MKHEAPPPDPAPKPPLPETLANSRDRLVFRYFGELPRAILCYASLMIRHKNQVRLHAADIRRLTRISGVSPEEICTVDALNRFIETQLTECDQETPESRLLRLLLLDEKINPYVP